MNKTMNRLIKFGPIKTSRIELVDILKAWIAISLAFAFIYTGISFFGGGLSKLLSSQFLIMFLISLLTAGFRFFVA